MADNNEKFKLTTRRYLAWGGMFIGFGTCAFIAIWQLLFGSGCREMGMLALGALIEAIGLIIGFYFSKKVKEE